MFYRGWIKSSPLKPAQSYGDGHWELFQETRKRHNENICAETNKLVLRLDKLVNSEDGKKPDGDKSLVEWTSDSLVKLCPYCARSFSFALRRHHCRVCGAVLCSSCSRFLEYKDACKLVKPTKLYTDPYDRIEDRLQNKEAEEKPKIRTCEDCQRLLDKRIQTIEDYYCQPAFHDFYEKLRKNMADADELILSHNSLLDENRQPKPELKSRIQDIKHEVALMSSKLSKMAEKETGKQAFMLRSINQSVAYWLKESLESRANRVYGTKRESSTGWVAKQPVGSAEAEAEENPLLIQLRNLDGYIEQARSAGRFEEVSALEESKRDLEIEYLIQKDLTI